MPVTRSGSGVYVASDPGECTPRRLVVEGKRLSRFMDSIYLDRPCEKLDHKKVQALNKVRRPLLDIEPISAVNLSVRKAFARGLDATRPATVLEWGCGYHPMHDLFPGTAYAGLDIDPEVVEHNRVTHPDQRWYEADRQLSELPTSGHDAIVSMFVFHFRISRSHIATMRRTLKPTGILLANVYRRSTGSRRELASQFEQAGFRVRRQKDAANLCTDHEYWCLTRTDHPDPAIPAAVLDRAAAAT